MTDEQLTNEERKDLERAAAFADAPWCRAVAKLLRLHDRYKARVEELERVTAGIVGTVTPWHGLRYHDQRAGAQRVLGEVCVVLMKAGELHNDPPG